MVGFCERLPLPPNYADSSASWSVDQVTLSLWLRHCAEAPKTVMHRLHTFLFTSDA